MGCHRYIPLGAGALAVLAAGCAKQTNASASASVAASDSAATVALVSVPVVGCASDGQVGPQAAPKEDPTTLNIAPSIGAKLAYYAMQSGPGDVGPSVLAPRGWFCAGVYRSDGATLVVAPKPLTPADLMSRSWTGATGDAVVARLASGDGVGRYQVAEVIARVFPARQAFVTRLLANHPSSRASDFPVGPYPTDKVVDKDAETVEFQSPANTVGLGTDVKGNNRLKPGTDPVSGVAIVTPADAARTPELSLAAVRLPAALTPLAPVIVRYFENCITGVEHMSSAGAPPDCYGLGDRS